MFNKIYWIENMEQVNILDQVDNQITIISKYLKQKTESQHVPWSSSLKGGAPPPSNRNPNR